MSVFDSTRKLLDVEQDFDCGVLDIGVGVAHGWHDGGQDRVS